jgi:hypothetical protein
MYLLNLLVSIVPSAELRSPYSRTLHPSINKGPILEVEFVRMLAFNERCYNVQELTFTVVQKGRPSAD